MPCPKSHVSLVWKYGSWQKLPLEMYMFWVHTDAVLPSTYLEVHASKGFAYRVVMEPYQGKGYRLLTDDFYLWVKLMQDLLKRGTYSTGTIRPNHKNFPEDLKVDKKIQKMYLKLEIFDLQPSAPHCCFMDRRDVLVLSSMHMIGGDSYEAPPRRTNSNMWLQHVYERGWLCRSAASLLLCHTEM